MSEEKELKPLSEKHQRVLDEYVICWEKTKAYKAAYPRAKHESAKASAARLFTDVNFQAHLQERLKEFHMSADEALKLMADIARGDLGDFIDNNGILNIADVRLQGKTKLIKKLKQKTVLVIGKKSDDEDKEITDIEIELYPADAAVERILRVHEKLKDGPTINISWKDFVSGNSKPGTDSE